MHTDTGHERELAKRELAKRELAKRELAKRELDGETERDGGGRSGLRWEIARRSQRGRAREVARATPTAAALGTLSSLHLSRQ